MKSAETRPLIECNTKSKYSKYTFIQANNLKLELDTISESFDEKAKIVKNDNCSSIGGLLCIVVAVIDWVLMSEIVQSSEQNNYNKPFFIRFMVISSYVLLFIPWICVYSFNKRLISNNLSFTHWITPDKSQQQSRGRITRNISYSSTNTNINNDGELIINHTVNTFHVFLSIILVTFLILFCGYIWYISLPITVAAINNTIFQSNCVFVLIFSYFLLEERITLPTVFAALIAITGVALISFSTGSSASSSSSFIGIVLCLLAMILFALFEVSFKYFGRHFFRVGYELSDTLLYQSCIGLCNIVMFWPFLMFLNYFKIEIFELPTDYDQLINGLILPCSLDLLFTSALLCGITLCGASFMSIGLILVIPGAFIADILIFEKAQSDIINIYSIIGSVCIIIGFILIQVYHNHDHDNNEYENEFENENDKVKINTK